jgi:hypothetical protein
MEAAIQQHPVPTTAEFHAAIARRADRWYSACLKITRSPDLAADAVQDAEEKRELLEVLVMIGGDAVWNVFDATPDDPQ